MDAAPHPVLKENEQALAELLELFKGGSVLPFVGAGMSASFYPGWGRFLLQEAQRVGCKTTVAALLKAGKYEEAAEELARKRRGLAFEDMMRQQFSPRSLEGTEITGAVALLPSYRQGPASSRLISTDFWKRCLNAPALGSSRWFPARRLLLLIKTP